MAEKRPETVPPAIRAEDNIGQRRHTRRDGDSVIFESPWWHITFDENIITIINKVDEDDLAITKLSHDGKIWQQIEHEGRSYNPGRLLYSATTGRFYSGVRLPPEAALLPELGDNLSACALALHCVYREDPDWLSARPLLEQARHSSLKQTGRARCAIPHFLTVVA